MRIKISKKTSTISWLTTWWWLAASFPKIIRKQLISKLGLLVTRIRPEANQVLPSQTFAKAQESKGLVLLTKIWVNPLTKVTTFRLLLTSKIDPKFGTQKQPAAQGTVVGTQLESTQEGDSLVNQHPTLKILNIIAHRELLKMLLPRLMNKKRLLS